MTSLVSGAKSWSVAKFDPCGFDAGDTNLYRFVDDDPANSTDPTGLNGQSRKGVQPAGIIDKWLLGGKVGIYVCYADGTELTTSTNKTADLRKILKDAIANRNQIKVLQLTGHGDPEGMDFSGQGDNERLEALNLGGIMLGNDEITKLLKDALWWDAKIGLYGCDIGDGPNNFAKQLSKELPHMTVTAGSWGQLRLIHPRFSIGFTVTYKGGVKIEEYVPPRTPNLPPSQADLDSGLLEPPPTPLTQKELDECNRVGWVWDPVTESWNSPPPPPYNPWDEIENNG